MGKKKEHRKKLLGLAKEIGVLGEAVEKMEKNMETTWTDEVERLDLERLKRCMQKIEKILFQFQDEIGHLENLHCSREVKAQPLKKRGPDGPGKCALENIKGDCFHN